MHDCIISPRGLRNLTQYIYSFAQFTYLSDVAHLPTHKPSPPVAAPAAAPCGPVSSFYRPAISCLHGAPQLWTDSSSSSTALPPCSMSLAAVLTVPGRK